MRKSTIAVVFGLAGLVAGLLLSNRLSAAATTSYGEDRAQIEDLQARYLFALDFHDPQLYASTFTADGILDYGEGDVKGREAIIKVIAGMPGNRPSPPTSSGGFGHYEDELLKVNGQWFFTKRKIYNEGSARWQYKGSVNPAW